MPVHSNSSHAYTPLPITQPLGAVARNARYTREQLPSVASVGDDAQSVREMGERLISHVACTQHVALSELASSTSGLEGLPGVGQPSVAVVSPVGLTVDQTTSLLEVGVRTLDALIVEQQDHAAGESAQAVLHMTLAVPALVQGDLDGARRAAAGSQAAAMVAHVADYFSANPQSSIERAQTLLDFCAKVLGNEFESAGGRWAANVSNVLLRDLATVGLTTTLRQLAGMALESSFILEGLAPTTRQWIGASVMLLGPCLNILGAVREERHGTATDISRLARGAMLGLSLGVLGASLFVNPPGPLSQLSSFATQVSLYTVLRDLMQLFVPMGDNTTAMNGPSTAMSGLGYGATQVVTSLLMDTLAPHSGAGYPMGVAANAEQAAEALLSGLLAQATDSSVATASPAEVRAHVVQAIEQLRPQLSHDLMRGLLNTLAEVSDDLLRPAIARHREVQALLAMTRAQAIADGRDPEAAVAEIPADQRQGLRIYFDTPRLPLVGAGLPSCAQFLDQMLTTNAMRTSIFQAIMGAILTTGTVLGQLGLNTTQQNWAGYGVLAAVIQVGYTPFLLAHDRAAAPVRSDHYNRREGGAAWVPETV